MGWGSGECFYPKSGNKLDDLINLASIYLQYFWKRKTMKINNQTIAAKNTYTRFLEQNLGNNRKK
ncbi:MAG: hypothetical protein ACKPGB_04820, partial [Dolichospermum sp.]